MSDSGMSDSGSVISDEGFRGHTFVMSVPPTGHIPPVSDNKSPAG